MTTKFKMQLKVDMRMLCIDGEWALRMAYFGGYNSDYSQGLGQAVLVPRASKHYQPLKHSLSVEENVNCFFFF